MSRPSLHDLVVPVLLVAGMMHPLQAAAQGGGVVQTQPTIVDINFTQTAKAIEGDGTAVGNVELKLEFASSAGASRYDGNHQLNVTFETQNGTATGGTCGSAGADFVPVASQLTFTGQSSATINITICGDALSEGDEQFTVRFTTNEPNQATAAVIRPSRDGAVIISDNEALPQLSITPAVQIQEPSTGQAFAVFTVSLTGPPTQRPVTVDFATSPGTASAGNACPSGRESVDYVTKTGTLTFGPPPAGTLVNPREPRTQQIQVPVCSDGRRSEPSETFTVTLTRAVNAGLPAGSKPSTPSLSPSGPTRTGTATIVD
jgi:hypothetical protein